VPSLDIRDLGVRYGTKTGTVDALSHVNLSMRDGDFVVDRCASAAARRRCSCIAGFLPPTEGEILLAASRSRAPAPTAASCSRSTRSCLGST
jgi:taurine transport system ATP-binding protein